MPKKGFKPEVFFNNYNEQEITSSKTTFTSEGTVSHNVSFYQQLSTARYHVTFYSIKQVFWEITNSAFKLV